MAINKIMMAGIVVEQPRLYEDANYGRVLEVKLDINRKDLNRVDRITCLMISNYLIDKGLDTIEIGDYLMSQSCRIATVNEIQEKIFICPHCGEESVRKRRITRADILLYDFEVMKNISLEDSIGINKAYMMGLVRNDLRKVDELSKAPTKFQLVLNRCKGLENHLVAMAAEDCKVTSFDVPMITCFGQVRDKAQEYVTKGDYLFADGIIQERQGCMKIPFQCKHCGEYSEQYFYYPTHEIIASRISPQRIGLEDIRGIVDEDIDEDLSDQEYEDCMQVMDHLIHIEQEKKARRKERRKAEKQKVAQIATF